MSDSISSIDLVRQALRSGIAPANLEAAAFDLKQIYKQIDTAFAESEQGKPAAESYGRWLAFRRSAVEALLDAQS